MKPSMSMYINRDDLKAAIEAYEAGRSAARIGAGREQKPDRYGDEWYWGFDDEKGV